MNRSAIILAGGFSSRLGQDKGLLQLAGKPLVEHVLDAVSSVIEERIVVVSSGLQADSYKKLLDSSVKVVVDDGELHGPLVGTKSGFKVASGDFSLLLPCDMPFLSKDVLSLLFELCVNRSAVIPRWPNGYIEPLHAVYQTRMALEAAENALRMDEVNIRSMVDKLKGVRFVSTLVLQQLDPELRTFFNVNTLLDLKKAENMLKMRKGRI
ncbi:MAG: molybdenum cofactor guanylyltransferase [Candidatus Bathyarchaeia archaeon]